MGAPSGKPPWSETWSLLQRQIQDGPNNANNRWAVASQINQTLMPPGSPPGPFWNCPASTVTRTLAQTKGALVFPFRTSVKAATLEEWRHAERRASNAYPTVQSAWKLFTKGNAGSQALLGIPRAASLRHDPALAQFSKVWPFETGFGPSPAPARGPFVLHAEVWPVLFSAAVKALMAADRSLIVDQAQVRALCSWAERVDAAGHLGAYFDAPAGMSASQIADCTSEEGWILGLR